LTLRTDRPIKKGSEDRLGYRQFSETLAHAIRVQPIEEGIVISVNGSWGSGKSSVVNMTLEALGKQERQLPKEKRSVVIRFEPWLVTGQTNLVVEFFSKLSVELKRTLGQQVFDAVSGMKDALVEKFSGIMDSSVALATVTGQLHVVAAAKSAKAVLKTPVKNELDKLHENRECLCKLLSKQDRRIVVVIDDIDRLYPVEARQILGMLKSIADFPAVVYLLPADLNAVEAALGRAAVAGDVSYLDKIIQVKLDLPQPSSTALGTMFYELMADVRGGKGAMDLRHLDSVSRDVLDAFIDTPRAIVRLANAVQISWSAMAPNVYFPDLIALESLRLFAPSVYAYIQDDPQKFLGRDASNGQRIRDGVFGSMSSAKSTAVRTLVNHILPESGAENVSRSGSAAWGRRIADKEGFELYFRWSLPSGVASVADLLAVQDAINGSGDVGKLLVETAAEPKHGPAKLHSMLTAIYEGRMAVDSGTIGGIKSIINVADFLAQNVSLNGLLPTSWFVRRAIAALFLQISTDLREEKLLGMLVDRDVSITGGVALLSSLIPARTAGTPHAFEDPTVMAPIVKNWVTNRVLKCSVTAMGDTNPEALIHVILDAVADPELATSVAKKYLTTQMLAERLTLSLMTTVQDGNVKKRELRSLLSRNMVSADELLKALNGSISPRLSAADVTDLKSAKRTLDAMVQDAKRASV
jgi:Predicted P-loop ATPase